MVQQQQQNVQQQQQNIQQNPSAPSQNQQLQPQVITLQQLQNFMPSGQTTAQQIHQLNAADAVQLQQQVQALQAAAVAGSPQAVSQSGAQAQHLKALYTSPQQSQQVFSMQQPQIIQLKQPDGTTQQIIQLKPDQIPQQPVQQLISGGQIIQNPNGMFQVLQQMQPMQTVTVDGQEALFIPNQLGNAQAIQIGGQQAFITPSGQIVRAPMMAPGNFLHNMTQTVQLPNGKKSFFNLPNYFSSIPRLYCIAKDDSHFHFGGD